MKKEVPLSWGQKKAKSIIKRLRPFVNWSSCHYIQHLTEGLFGDQSFLSFRKDWITNNEKNNDVDLVRLLIFICNQREFEKIPGALAELGVYKGNSAKVLHRLMPDRKFYLFDTFEGFEDCDLQKEPTATKQQGFFKDTSLEAVQQFLGKSKNLVFCPGYFPKTADLVDSSDVFSLVHIDADLYQPTINALEFFYPKLSPGGYLIVHDYHSEYWQGVTQACDEFFKDKPESLICIPDKSGTAMIRKSK